MKVWFGKVVDRDDPLQLGRVRVRIVDWTPDSAPAADLPWAPVMMPATGASHAGIGFSPNDLQVGSWVMGFFLDGNLSQRPFVLGTFHAVQLDEPDTHFLSRGTDDERERAEGVVTADGSEWSEPESPYAAQYPYNRVRVTESGHVFEVDDTPGKERIREKHRSGTFREVGPDGTQVVRVVGDSYEVVAGGKNVLVRGTVNLTVDGNTNTLIGGDWNVVVKGNKVETVHGTILSQSLGEMDLRGQVINLNKDKPDPESEVPEESEEESSSTSDALVATRVSMRI